jgi:peptide/nickel transport system ATP-binding protein
VPDDLCEREVPPIRVLEGGHQIKCHLSDAELAGMEPVFKVAAE